MNNLSTFKSNTNHILKIFAAAAVILLVLSVNKICAQIDPTFGTNGVTTTNLNAADAPLAAFTLPDGKILVVASRENFSGPPVIDYYFLRYNSNGTLDSTYGGGGIVYVPITSPAGVNVFLSAVMQPDGKIILAGYNFNNGLIVRVNQDGTLDSGFATGGIHRPNLNQTGSDGIADVVVLPDGKIMVAGYVNGFSFPYLYLLRYNANGTLDESFGTEGYIVYTNASAPTYLFLQSTGKLLVVAPVDYNTATHGSVRRFNSDGSVDGSFTTVFFPAGAARLRLQTDDKILLLRSTVKQESLDQEHLDMLLSRFGANGAVDTGFGNGGEMSADVTNYFDDFPSGLQVMANGEILVSARTEVPPNRSSVRGSTLSLVRLSSTGAVLGKILVTKAHGHYRTAILPQPDGKIVVVDYVSLTGNSDTDILLTRVTGVPVQTYRFHGVPFDFRYPAFDGKADPAVFRPSDRKWYLHNVFPGYFFGLADDIPVPSDYIGDLSTDMAMFRPSNGTWYIARDFQNAATNYITIQWGLNGDIAAPADYDGDGKSDLAVFRPSNGVWYIRNSADNSFTIFQWGLNGDKPVSGDYDGDGKYDVGVFRPSEGNWYILRSSDGQPYILHFGLNGDIPVHEDYDGDGKFDIAVYRPSEGIWYRLNSSDGSFFAMAWAIPADIPTPADYDGDGKADIAVWRQGNGRWYVYRSTDAAMGVYNWGIMGDVPLQRR